MNRLILASVIAAGLTGPAIAEQVREKAEIGRTANVSAAGSLGSEPLSVVVTQGGETLWTGSLKIGRPYGSASFSQSLNEADEPCPGDPQPNNGNHTSSRSLNFSVNRANWQQEPDAFNVSLNLSQPIPACKGQGNDSFGINRMVKLPRGQAVVVEAMGGVSIRLTRAR